MYTLSFNPKSKTWCIYNNKNNKLIMQSTDYDEMKIQYEQLEENNKNRISMHIKMLHKNRSGRSSRIYKFYHNDKYIDTGTRKYLLEKYPYLPKHALYHYYKLGKYRFEIVKE